MDAGVQGQIRYNVTVLLAEHTQAVPIFKHGLPRTASTLPARLLVMFVVWCLTLRCATGPRALARDQGGPAIRKREGEDAR